MYTGEEELEKPADPDAVSELEDEETETTDTEEYDEEAEDWDTQYTEELGSDELQDGLDWDTRGTDELGSDEIQETANQQHQECWTESEEETKDGDLRGKKKEVRWEKREKK